MAICGSCMEKKKLEPSPEYNELEEYYGVYGMVGLNDYSTMLKLEGNPIVIPDRFCEKALVRFESGLEFNWDLESWMLMEDSLFQLSRSKYQGKEWALIMPIYNNEPVHLPSCFGWPYEDREIEAGFFATAFLCHLNPWLVRQYEPRMQRCVPPVCGQYRSIDWSVYRTDRFHYLIKPLREELRIYKILQKK